MSDIETRLLALRVGTLNAAADVALEKYNPYHGKDGRFSSAGGAHFVSTTNAKTTERMRRAHADAKAKEEAAKPKTPTKDQMTGTPKQIEYAAKVREKVSQAWTQAAKNVEDAMKEGVDGDLKPIASDLVRHLRDTAASTMTERDAGKILDRHYTSPQQWAYAGRGMNLLPRLEVAMGDKYQAKDMHDEIVSIMAGSR